MWAHVHSKYRKPVAGKQRQSIIQPPVDPSLPIFVPIARLPCVLGILHRWIWRIQTDIFSYLLNPPIHPSFSSNSLQTYLFLSLLILLQIKPVHHSTSLLTIFSLNTHPSTTSHHAFLHGRTLCPLHPEPDFCCTLRGSPGGPVWAQGGLRDCQRRRRVQLCRS